MLEKTICAVATGYDTGAISVIRVSGPDTFEILSKVFSKDLKDAPGYTAHYGILRNPETSDFVDEVIVTIYRAPRSYTGEDMAEVSCHGGRLVTSEVLMSLIEAGCELAERGEFTERAYLNGKMDLTKAEAINDVILARTKDQLALAGKELRGSVKKLLDPLKEDMVQVIGNIEVNIDYPEYEDVEVMTNETVAPKVEEWIAKIDEILKESEKGKLIREGVRTVIAGRTNAGKSSLFNALLEEDKAIVTDIEGTTRDIVEGEIRLETVTLLLQDTAGLRDTEDKVESIGIRKTKESIDKADLVIVVLDATKPMEDEDWDLLDITEGKNRIVVFNKKDLIDVPGYGIYISAKEGNISALIKEINERFAFCKDAVEKPALSNERHIGLLHKARVSLNDAREAIARGTELDLVCVDLHEAHNAIREIEGTYTKENLLDDIFSRFCLGK